MKGPLIHDKPVDLKITANEGIGELAAKIHQAVELRAYELYVSRGREHGRDLDDWKRAESELLRSTPEDVKESIYGNVKVRVELPGFSPEEIEVGVEQNRIIVWAQKERQDKAWPVQEAESRSEWIQSETRENAWPAEEAEPKSESYSFLRIYELSRPVEPAKAIASLENSIFTIEVPRASGASRSAGAQGL